MTNEEVSVADFKDAAQELFKTLFPSATDTDWIEFSRVRTTQERKAEVEVGRKLQKAVAEGGFAGVTWPKEFGGQGLSSLHEIALREALAPFDSAALHPFRIGVGQCGPTILEYGTTDQKSRYIPTILDGTDIWCQLFSEPNAGSDLANVQTRAEPADNGFIVNGQKVWTSGADLSDYGLLVARTQAGSERHAGLSMFIVKMDQPGIEINTIKQMTGATNFCEVFFEDVFLSQDTLVGELGNGWAQAMFMLTSERKSIGQRRVFHDQIKSYQTFLHSIANSENLQRADQQKAYVQAEVTRLLAIRVQQLEESATALPGASSLVKLAMNRTVKQISAATMEWFGLKSQAWAGTDSEIDLWRVLFMQSPGSSIAAGSDEIQRNIIGERVLGLPKDAR